MATELTDAEAVVLTVSAESDMILVRQVLRTAAQRIGLGLVDQTKIITAGSELARNILTYATGSRGTVRIEEVRDRGRRGVKATFSDDGPGIPDIDQALTDGFSTNRSLGLGLPGARRLSDEMTITSTVGTGTTVVVVKWAR
jgi:serine/threonine-protein kinase RsbT